MLEIKIKLKQMKGSPGNHGQYWKKSKGYRYYLKRNGNSIYVYAYKDGKWYKSKAN